MAEVGCVGEYIWLGKNKNFFCNYYTQHYQRQPAKWRATCWIGCHDSDPLDDS